MKRYLIFFALTLVLLSCQRDKDISVRISAPEAFNKVELLDAFEVFVSEDTLYAVEILGDEKIISYVELRVEDSTLFISNDWNNKWLTPRRNQIKVVIHAPPLSRIVASEGCNVQTLSPITSDEFGLIMGGKVNEASLELDCTTFYFWNGFPSGGKLTLSGKTEILKIWSSAIMSVDARDLITEYAEVENKSQGDCAVHVVQRLEYLIAGTGDILLYGNPPEVVAKGDSSTGRLIRQ
jgi:hypothetical protein